MFAAMVVLIIYVKFEEGSPNTILSRSGLVGHTTLNFFSVGKMVFFQKLHIISLFQRILLFSLKLLAIEV